MTKQEVLHGALALNGIDKKYTVTVKDDKIIIEAEYCGTRMQESTFRYTAYLKDDKTYTDTSYDFDGYHLEYCVRKIAVSYGSDGSKEVFDSEEIKKVLRAYLERYGYKRSKKSFTLALCIAIPMIITILISLALIIPLASESEFVDTNGPLNFSLTEITRDDILSKNNSYRSLMSSKRYSGHRTNIVGTQLRDCDYDHIIRSFGRIDGVVTLQATKITGNALTLNISSSIESGNAEIVIIIDGEYYGSVDMKQEQSVALQGISNKEVIVKLAGEGAKIEVDVSRAY